MINVMWQRLERCKFKIPQHFRSMLMYFYLVKILQHYTLNFRYLSLHFYQLFDLFRVLDDILHVLFHNWPAKYQQEYASWYCTKANTHKRNWNKAFSCLNLPKIFIETFCNSSIGFTASISFFKVGSHPFQKGYRYLLTERFFRHHTVSCKTPWRYQVYGIKTRQSSLNLNSYNKNYCTQKFKTVNRLILDISNAYRLRYILK